MKPLRRAAQSLGLKPNVLATLEAMLACLPRGKPATFVFASNATLAFRRNGISDRTVRRHIATLEEAGLLIRHDSANKKRYSRLNPLTGEVLRFGFDLTPLFEQRNKLELLASQATREQDAVLFMKSKIRAHTAARLEQDPNDLQAINTLKVLRRKMTIGELQAVDEQLSEAVEDDSTQPPSKDTSNTQMSARDRQNVRHIHKSNTEELDSELTPNKPYPKDILDEQISIETLLVACPSVRSFALTPIQTWADAARHAQTLAPMMGIDKHTLHAAIERQGMTNTIKALFSVLQMQGTIRQMAAYFKSITSGRRAAQFSADQLIRRLLKFATANAFAN